MLTVRQQPPAFVMRSKIANQRNGTDNEQSLAAVSRRLVAMERSGDLAMGEVAWRIERTKV